VGYGLDCGKHVRSLRVAGHLVIIFLLARGKVPSSLRKTSNFREEITEITKKLKNAS
jgi:hypothetical protein